MNQQESEEKSNMEMRETAVQKVDELIEVLAENIKAEVESVEGDRIVITEKTKALAELIAARARVKD